VEASLRDAHQRQDLLEKGLADPRPAPASAGAPRDIHRPERAAGPAPGLRSRYTEEHPDVQSLKARIARLERRVRRGGERRDPRLRRPSVVAARSQFEKLQYGSAVSRRGGPSSRAGRTRSARGWSKPSYRARAGHPDARLPEAERELPGPAQQEAGRADGGQARDSVKEHFSILDPGAPSGGSYSPNRPSSWLGSVPRFDRRHRRRLARSSSTPRSRMSTTSNPSSPSRCSPRSPTLPRSRPRRACCFGLVEEGLWDGFEG
jgi:hypothetical protein